MTRNSTSDAVALNRLAQMQTTWSARERRRQRELNYFLQRRLAWELSLAQGQRTRQSA